MSIHSEIHPSRCQFSILFLVHSARQYFPWGHAIYIAHAKMSDAETVTCDLVSLFFSRPIKIIYSDLSRARSFKGKRVTGFALINVSRGCRRKFVLLNKALSREKAFLRSISLSPVSLPASFAGSHRVCRFDFTPANLRLPRNKRNLHTNFTPGCVAPFYPAHRAIIAL